MVRSAFQKFRQRQYLVKIIPGQGEHNLGEDVRRFEDFQKLDYSFEVVRSSYMVIVWLQPFQTHLIKGRGLDGDQLVYLFAGGWIAENANEKSPVRSLPVEPDEMGMQKRVPTGEGDLAENLVGGAEFAETIEYFDFLI